MHVQSFPMPPNMLSKFMEVMQKFVILILPMIR